MKIETKKTMVSVLLLCAGVSMIILGIFREEAECVIEKATRICMECIGIG